MTADQFRTAHGDPTTWTLADHETYDVLRHNDTKPVTPATPELARCARHWASATGHRRHQAAQQSADRLRKLLAPAA